MWFLSDQTCGRAGFAVALVAVFLIICPYYACTRNHQAALTDRIGSQTDSSDPRTLLVVADHFYCLNNGPAAGPLYEKAERLFSDKADARNALYAKIGRLRSNAETMSFVDLSRFLGEQLQNPIVKADKELRLWCLIAKGYTDIEIDYRATKRDWHEAQEIAKSLGQDQWVTRANGELGRSGAGCDGQAE